MIYVDKSQLDQIDYLLSQAAQGNHILFDPEFLRAVFSRDSAMPFHAHMTDEEAYAVEPHIEKLLAIPSLELKRAYLEKLDSPTLERVIRAYFNIVENSLYESGSTRH